MPYGTYFDNENSEWQWTCAVEFNDQNEMITKPEKQGDLTKTKGKVNLQSNYPNCIAITSQGRIYVGDAQGQISVWDIQNHAGQIVAEGYFKITHMELEGDAINQIMPVPNNHQQLLVQTRDNCIRLVEFESSRGTRIRKRFFGN